MLSKIFRVALLLPFLYWVYMIFFGDLGVDPAKELNHSTGEFALYLLLLNVLIGILIGFKFRFPMWTRFLLQNRRFLGVTTFFYLICHMALYFALESFEPEAVTQMLTKQYLIFGFSAWLILLVLALTSNNFSVRKLGTRRWKGLHRLVYLACALITVHVLSIEKADLVKFGIIMGTLWLAFAVRFIRYLILLRNKSSSV